MSIFTSWDEERTNALWGQQPICLQHSLHQHPLFSMTALAELIDKYGEYEKAHNPTGDGERHYMLVRVGTVGAKKEWREGDFAGLNGGQVITAIQQADHPLWLNLLRVHEIDSRYGKLLDEIFAEIQQHLPHYATYNRINGILISSPSAQVYYHFDNSGQSLWQIHGSKRVYVYPNAPPFLKTEELEAVCFYNHETSIPFQEWYDDHATKFDIGPGEMLSWPLNCPHRIENLSFSVSMTVEYQRRDIQRRLWVNATNHLLRKYGMSPDIRIGGPSFYGKAALYAAMVKSGYLRQQRKQRRPVTFHLDPVGRQIEVEHV